MPNQPAVKAHQASGERRGVLAAIASTATTAFIDHSSTPMIASMRKPRLGSRQPLDTTHGEDGHEPASKTGRAWRLRPREQESRK